MSISIDAKDPAEAEMMPLKVHRKTEAAQDITLFELRRADHQELPPFTAGSHIVVQTPGGLLRRYSLCNACSERDRYMIAVKRDANGGGGSIGMVDDVAEGDQLSVSAPQNYFPLANDASSYLLIAGGIGITPILSMIHELQAKKADFRLVYCTRSAETTAFLSDLSSMQLAGRMLVHHDHGDAQRSLAIGPIVVDRPDGAHLYCCGPRPLMQAVRGMTAHWPSSTVHFEDFGTSTHAEPDGEKPFTVRLARSGETVKVLPGVSILDALRNCGIAAPSSCESGTCGSCRTRLLAGVAQHRDFVLDDDEQDSEIMICVSRAQSEELVLDL
ncbi:MAG: phthalate 4,5-dioxygenase reductase subunit [Herminiimonas sp.]|nr:phthalate 4,5-dioxygenase reductase subunit [Herminiimonas sp.]